jgi:hypothetical protein
VVIIIMIIIIAFKDSRAICGGRLEAMNGKLSTPGKNSFTKPYFGKWNHGTMDPTIPNYCRDSNGKEEWSTKSKTQTLSSY